MWANQRFISLVYSSDCPMYAKRLDPGSVSRSSIFLLFSLHSTVLPMSIAHRLEGRRSC